MGISNFYFTKISLAIPRASTVPTAIEGLSTRDMRLSEHARGAATATMPRFPRYRRGLPHRLVREDGGETCPRGLGKGEE